MSEGRKGRVGLFFIWVWSFYLGLEKGFGEGRTKEEEGEHEKE